jgi:Protein of unknown function (DUF2786)
MDNAQNERRARMLDKVRKLLAMARDGRGNSNEEEIAMRQANKLMAEYGIAEAECDIEQMDTGAMEFGEATAGMDGLAPTPGRVFKSYATWVGMISVGVARFTDSVATRKVTGSGQMLAFRGERQDVLLARWLLGVLVQSARREQIASGWTSRADSNAFLTSAASALQKRLNHLASERRKMYEDAQRTSNSRALVVVDRKHTEIVKRFGEQRTSKRRMSSRGASGASIAGCEAGTRINIPEGRPIAGQSRAMLN